MPVSLTKNLFWDDIGVVSKFPLKVLIEADVFASHCCSLHYFKSNKKRLQYEIPVCASFNRFRNDPEIDIAVQMRFIDRIYRGQRNWREANYNFVATYSKLGCSDSDEKTHEQVEATANMLSPLTATTVVSTQPGLMPSPSVGSTTMPGIEYDWPSHSMNSSASQSLNAKPELENFDEEEGKDFKNAIWPKILVTVAIPEPSQTNAKTTKKFVLCKNAFIDELFNAH